MPHFLKLFVLMLAVLALSACGGSSSSSDASSEPEEVITTASIVGGLDANGDLVGAAEGDAQSSGTMLGLYDVFGTRVAQATVGEDGRFSFGELSVGTYQLNRDVGAVNTSFQTASLISAQTTSSLPVNVSVVAAQTLDFGETLGFSRSDAIALIMDGVPETALVTGVLSPVPAGTTLEAAAEVNADEPNIMTIESKSWIFAIDETPQDPYGHEIDYFVVNAETGALTSMLDQQGTPAINGIQRWHAVGDVLRLKYEMDGDLETIVATAQSPEVIQYPVFADSEESESTESAFFGTASTDDNYDSRSVTLSPNQIEELSGIKVRRDKNARIMVGDREVELFGFVVAGTTEPWFVESAFQMLRFMRNNNIPDANIMGAVRGSSPIENIQAGFFTANPNSYVKEIQDRYEALEVKIKESRDAGKYPILIASVNSHGYKDGNIMIAPDLLALGIDKAWGNTRSESSFFQLIDEVIPFQDTNACRIRILLGMCDASAHLERYRNAFIQLDERPEVQIFTSSADNVGEGISALQGNLSLLPRYTAVQASRALGNDSLTLDSGSPLGLIFTKQMVNTGSIDELGNIITSSSQLNFFNYSQVLQAGFDRTPLRAKNFELFHEMPQKGEGCPTVPENTTLDSDGDGVPDAQEEIDGSNPRQRDSDGDNLTDGEEKEMGTSPTSKDTDGDGILDNDEERFGGDPTKADTDGDGLPDGLEQSIGTNLNGDTTGDNTTKDADLDADGDGLTNGEEVMLGTGPEQADADGNGKNDLEEMSENDRDGDGISDLDEIRGNTKFDDADSDDDGVDDGTEIGRGTDPNDADSDDDGVNDNADQIQGVADPSSVSVTPTSIEVDRGSIGQLVFTAHYSNGSSQVLTTDSNVVWSSSDSTTVSTLEDEDAGKVFGVKEGSATVTATYYGAFNASATVTVTPSECADGGQPPCISDSELSQFNLPADLGLSLEQLTDFSGVGHFGSRSIGVIGEGGASVFNADDQTELFFDSFSSLSDRFYFAGISPENDQNDAAMIVGGQAGTRILPYIDGEFGGFATASPKGSLGFWSLSNAPNSEGLIVSGGGDSRFDPIYSFLTNDDPNPDAGITYRITQEAQRRLFTIDGDEITGQVSHTIGNTKNGPVLIFIDNGDTNAGGLWWHDGSTSSLGMRIGDIGMQPRHATWDGNFGLFCNVASASLTPFFWSGSSTLPTIETDIALDNVKCVTPAWRKFTNNNEDYYLFAAPDLDNDLVNVGILQVDENEAQAVQLLEASSVALSDGCAPGHALMMEASDGGTEFFVGCSAGQESAPLVHKIKIDLKF